MPTLREPAIRDSYAQACANLYGSISTLADAGILQGMVNAVNQALILSGVPTLGFHLDPGSAADGEFDFTNWQINFGHPSIAKPKTSRWLIGCANTVYHESRHCEQWYRMAKAVARGYEHISNFDLFNRWNTQDRDAATIHAKMFINAEIADKAVKNPDYSPVSKSYVGAPLMWPPAANFSSF